MKYKEYFDNISNESFSRFCETSTLALEEIVKNRRLLCDMLDNVLEDEVLIKSSECYDFLDKIVCYVDEKKGIQVRISLFNSKYANRIHYHRWDYSACILNGSYRQLFYGIYDKKDISQLYPYDPIYIEHCIPNHIYSLNHQVVHSVEAKPDTVSICIRGKAWIDRFQTIDPRTNTSWWQYGAKMEASEERNMKSVTTEYLKDRIDYIKRIINP